MAALFFADFDFDSMCGDFLQVLQLGGIRLKEHCKLAVSMRGRINNSKCKLILKHLCVCEPC